MVKTSLRYGNSLTDQQLVEMSIRGDRQAFAEIVSRYESTVARTVMGIVGSGAEAEDIGQDTFVRFYRSMANFRWESSLRTYLTRIAINLALNEVKKRKRVFSFFVRQDEEKELDVIDPHGVMERTDAADAVEKALQKLSPDFKTVITLRLIEGYSTKETAQILKLPVGTVLSRLSRAQAVLKKQVKLIMPEL